MAIVDHAARDVQVSDSVAVKQQLPMRVVVKKRGNRKRAKHEGEARFLALALVALFQSTAV